MKPLHIDFSPDNFKDYELIDSGNGQKLERFGEYLFVRPESQAIWQPHIQKSVWSKADAVFKTSQENGKAQWQFNKKLPERWPMSYKDLKFWASPTSFRHLGVFPEQAPHWDWLQETINKSGRKNIRVLNLFGYTGLSTLASAKAGASVTHIDASGSAIAWAKDNQKLSGLEKTPIRFICDDAVKFVKREIKRGVKYDGIIMDPPKFGRGPKGEIWKIEGNLPILLSLCQEIFSSEPIFSVITIYATELSPISLNNMLEDYFKVTTGENVFGELVTVETERKRKLPQAIFARWNR